MSALIDLVISFSLQHRAWDPILLKTTFFQFFKYWIFGITGGNCVVRFGLYLEKKLGAEVGVIFGIYKKTREVRGWEEGVGAGKNFYNNMKIRFRGGEQQL